MSEDSVVPDEAEVAVDLASRIQAGDASAEAELVERYSDGLTFMLRRMTGRPDLADDLHQDAFRIVLERLRGPGLAEPERLAGFLHRTARNLFIGDYRKRARRQTDELEDADSPTDSAPSPLSRTMLDQEASWVRRLIRELKPDRDRQVLYRFYIAEEPKARICADFGLSSLHFNRVLHRARQRFKDLLERSEKRQRLERRIA